MMSSFRIFIQAISVCLLMSVTVSADILVVLIDESALSYQDRPSNYQNSPTNYQNSNSNFTNSASNYQNSSSNYKNSRSNFANGKSGKHRLFNENKEWLGYYTFSNSGVLNFYSTSGERVFYHPSSTNTRGVFYSESSEWAGIVGEMRGRLCLGLTKQGYYTLLSKQQ